MHNAGQSHRTDFVMNRFFCTGTSEKSILKKRGNAGRIQCSGLPGDAPTADYLMSTLPQRDDRVNGAGAPSWNVASEQSDNQQQPSKRVQQRCDRMKT